MTREEIIAQFQGGSEIAPTVYVFNGSLQQLQEVANTSIRTFTVGGVLHFVSIEDGYNSTDPRMEIL